MSKVLILEENKSLSYMIAESINSICNYETIILSSMQEFREHIFLKNYENLQQEILVAMVSDKLIDSITNSSINEILSYNIPVIAMSSSKDKKYNISNVVFEIYKENVNEILYAISFIERLEKNKINKILVVGDSKIYRKQIIKELKNQLFLVVEANDGKEALEKIANNEENQFKLVITDYIMDEINGLDLTYYLRKKYTKEELGIIAIPSENDKNIITEFLKSGANDTINFNFTKEEFISRITNSLIYIENITNMREAAYKDYLTGLFNRRYFYNKMEENIKSKELKNFSLAIIDIDNFKSINDTYGHDAGDIVLKKISNTLLSNIKHSDLAARYGGEEFVLVLKNITEEHTKIFLEKILKELSEVKYDFSKNKNFKVTASIGCVFNEDKEKNLDDIIKLADQKLYIAKENGKNQVII